MKGDLTRKLLEAVSYSAKNAGDIFYAITTADFPASPRKLEYLARYHSYLRGLRDRNRETEMRYSNLLYRLKRNGLIREKGRGENRVISITQKGIAKLHALLNQSFGRHYPKEESSSVIIVAFDVPERRKKERNWLRRTLKNLGYSMVQKSIWAGTIKIPEAFLIDLTKRKLIENVEILSVNDGQLQNPLYHRKPPISDDRPG